MPPLREAEARAAAALQRLLIARDTLDAEETRARERLAELDRRLAQFEADVARERTLVADAEAALAQLAQEEETLRNEARASAERRTGVDARVAEADAVVGAAEKTFGELTGALADLTARRNQLDARPRASRPSASPRMESEIANIEAGLAAAAESQPDLAALAAAVESRAGRRRRRPSRPRSPPKPRTAPRASNLDAARMPLADAERAVQRLDTEAKTLMKLLAVETKSMWPPVIDKITVEKGYEIALGAALGDDLDAPVDQTHAMRWMGAAIDPSDPALPEGARAARAVRPGAAGAGAPARPDRRRRARPTARGSRRCSSPASGWSRAKATSGAGTALPPTPMRRPAPRAASPQRSRLADIDGELVTARADGRGQAQGRRGRAGRADRGRRRRSRRPRALARGAARGRQRARTARQGRARDGAQRRADLGAHRSQDAADRRAATRPQAATDEAERALAATAAARPSWKRQLADDPRRDRGQARAARRGARRGAGAGPRGRAGRPPAHRHRHRPRRPGATAATAPSPRSRRSTPAAPRPSRSARRSPTRRRCSRRSAALLIGEVEAAEAARRAAADRLAEAENALGRLPTARSAPRSKRWAPPARRPPAPRSASKAPSAGSPTSPTKSAKCWRCEPDGARGACRDRAGRYAAGRRRSSKPNWNACAASASGSAPSTCAPRRNCGEIETQHNTLTTERDDLVEAIARLRQGIISLNKEARERLLASFATVNTHFQRLFTELFGGGTAELQLIENDDPLEAGLEIFAKPPGKKPATLSLLSGGEQALTALALIFAVFLTNPAPICVLDEVDAPLDDHNVERFCDLLDEMGRSTDTRFVIITHNPITMARMNRLYGVTMAERGISQLVSVDLEAAVKIRDSAA